MKQSMLIAVSVVTIALATAAARENSSRTQTIAGRYSVSINGMEMYYEIRGDGAPLVLLHGFFSSGKLWNPVVRNFSKEFQVIIPDLRGHGHSTNPSKKFTHRQSALDVFALLDHLGIDDFKAMGISSGGMTLLHMATQQPDRVKSMVLIGTTIYFPKEAREIMRQTTFEKRKDPDWIFVYDYQTRGDEQLRELFSQFHEFKDSYDDMNFTSPYLSTITAQTLIIHGDRDIFFPISIPLQMYRSIPNSYLWIVPNGDHVPIFGYMLPWFVGTTKGFLNNAWITPIKRGE